MYDDNQGILPVMTVDQALEAKRAVLDYIERVMTKIESDGEDGDYGPFPGSKKWSLRMSGAEKLAQFFGLSIRMELVGITEDWTGDMHGGEPFFSYDYRCRAVRGDVVVAEHDGNANSHESKWRYRWVSSADLRPGVNVAGLVERAGVVVEPAFAIERAETTGPYGKPAEYWQRFKVAIERGEATRTTKPKKDGGQMDAWAIETTVYQAPNPDIADSVNTIRSQAQKRAMTAAIRKATGTSDFFTGEPDGSAADIPAAAPRPARQDQAQPAQQQQQQQQRQQAAKQASGAPVIADSNAIDPAYLAKLGEDIAAASSGNQIAQLAAEIQAIRPQTDKGVRLAWMALSQRSYALLASLGTDPADIRRDAIIKPDVFKATGLVVRRGLDCLGDATPEELKAMATKIPYKPVDPSDPMTRLALGALALLSVPAQVEQQQAVAA